MIYNRFEDAVHDLFLGEFFRFQTAFRRSDIPAHSQCPTSSVLPLAYRASAPAIKGMRTISRNNFVDNFVNDCVNQGVAGSRHR
ncbi:hypothetical protein OE647_08650 [Defluviimonas sp. WL0075]|uniref:Uncharacterized protein n=1 Tax=Albidovulum sediminicola TaxID=2984331 RepID=A0ABT2Z1B4_9RHOB|nr:hypothetical protein [Defluviimonas sp. WL0075]